MMIFDDFGTPREPLRTALKAFRKVGPSWLRELFRELFRGVFREPLRELDRSRRH